jgi:hypothetical protein
VIELVAKLLLSLFGERAMPWIRETLRKVAGPMVRWFLGLSPASKGLTLTPAVGGVAYGMLVLLFGSTQSAYVTGQQFYEASTNGSHPALSDRTREQASTFIGAWGQELFDRYSRQVASSNANIGDDQAHQSTGNSDENAWELAQKILALDGLSLGSNKIDADAVYKYTTRDVDPTCGCWREMNDPKHRDNSNPLHLGISAWIIVALERATQTTRREHLELLRATQLDSGAWPTLRSHAVQQGSTFTTPWAILALLDMQPKLTDEQDAMQVSRAIRKGVDWMLKSRNKDALWVLYPDWPLASAQRVSLSNSGLSLVALHQVLRAQQAVMPKAVLDRWSAQIAESDRALLQQLRPGISEDAFDTFGDFVPTERGLEIDRVQYLVLPWLMMGAVEAYASGNVYDRMNAIRFFDDYASRLDQMDKEFHRPGNDWRVPEALMALRYLAEHDYLRTGYMASLNESSKAGASADAQLPH